MRQFVYDLWFYLGVCQAFWLFACFVSGSFVYVDPGFARIVIGLCFLLAVLAANRRRLLGEDDEHGGE